MMIRNPQNPSGFQFQWDPQSLEIRTKSVERTLEPLVQQITILVNHRGPTNRTKGRSRKAETILQSVRDMVNSFVTQGKEIAADNPEIRTDLNAAIADVDTTGRELYDAVTLFVHDPVSESTRGGMNRAARAFLSAITRLLILADLSDVYLLLKALRIVEENIETIRGTNDSQELLKQWDKYGASVNSLIDLAGQRQVDLIDPRRRDDIAAARATLKKNSPLLLTSSKTFVRHPELPAARDNRDFAIKAVCDAVNVIHGVTQGSPDAESMFYDTPGDLAALMDEFDNRALMEPREYNESQVRPMLEEKLENIVSGSALYADSECTRPERRNHIIAECKNARQALQVLLRQYAMEQRQAEPSDTLKAAMQSLLSTTGELRRQLALAVVDHISDSFLEIWVPLQVLTECARSGNEAGVNQSGGPMLENQAASLWELAQLACATCPYGEGVKLVRAAAEQVKQLCPQVVNAARVLVMRPNSKVALENMDAFEDTWRTSVRLLMEAVDDITNISDFLAVSEGHVLEDVRECIEAVQQRALDRLDRSASAVRGRTERVCQVVATEMGDFRSRSQYVDKVMEAVENLREQLVPSFNHNVEATLNGLSRQERVDERPVSSTAKQVYEGVCNIRRQVVFERDQDGYESDYAEAAEERLLESQEDRVNERSMMGMMPPEQQQVFMQEMAGFYEEKKRLMREVTKWDDTANDLVVLAKKMCMIMMDMTDFTRGKGPLKTTMDVIQAAVRISECGSQLDHLAREIAEQCPDSVSKTDLLAYLQRIPLYCHQLKITSKVKADVQPIGGEIVVSGLDSATSLIQAAKNLMSAVIQVVKSSYAASTKYKQGSSQRPVVQWRMRAPGKKPLVQRERYEDGKEEMRRSQKYKAAEPMRELSQFDQPQYDADQE